MSRSSLAVHAAELRGLARRRIGAVPTGASAWMAAAFLVALAMAAILLARFGAGEAGTALALRVTARWCFLLFWPAYAGSAAAKVFGPRLWFGFFGGLARRGRAFGLAFAAALAVHVALVLWLMVVAADQRSPMLFFWVGVLATFALAMFSLPRLRDALGTRLWRVLCTVALEYIALVFAVDFIVEPLRASGLDHYPPSYFPFVVMLLAGTGLRLAAVVQSRRRSPTTL